LFHQDKQQPTCGKTFFQRKTLSHPTTNAEV